MACKLVENFHPRLARVVRFSLPVDCGIAQGPRLVVYIINHFIPEAFRLRNKSDRIVYVDYIHNAKQSTFKGIYALNLERKRERMGMSGESAEDVRNS